MPSFILSLALPDRFFLLYSKKSGLATRDYFILTVAAQEDEDPTILTVRPDGQNVELLCDLHRQPSENDSVVGWIIGQSQPEGVSALANGLVAGYSANIFNNNLIIRNIIMNDSRNETWYQCVIGMQDDGMSIDSTMILQPTRWGNITILYVAGEYLMLSHAWLSKVIPYQVQPYMCNLVYAL